MNERLTTRDLVEFLANQTGLDQKRAEKFIDAFSSYMSRGIEKNKAVKMLGFGTFKVILVRERESVHIQTGERFVIPAHHKLSFVPDKDFKEHINRPFSFFEPIETTESHIPKKVSFKRDEAHGGIADNETLYENDENTNPVVVMDGDDYDVLEEIQGTPIVSEVQDNVEYEALPEVEVDSVVFEDNESDNGYEPEYKFSETEDYTIEEDYNGLASDVVNNEPEHTTEENNNLYYNDESEETGIDDIVYNTENKKKSVHLWQWFLLLSLPLLVGSGIATFAFLHYNYNKSTPENSSNVSEQSTITASTNTPMPIGLTSIPDNGNVGSIGDFELIDEFLPDSVTTEAIVGGEEIDPETNTQEVKEEKKVIDWLAPSSEKSNTGTKRADKPNEKIESKNRDLPVKAETKTTSKTPATSTGSASPKTATNENKEKVIPSHVRMTAGSSLTQIAMEYYGDKVFWVYIYEYNKSRIKNYDNIPVGTEIRLPLPKTYGINAKSKSSVDKAKQKQSQLLKWDNWDDYKQQ